MNIASKVNKGLVFVSHGSRNTKSNQQIMTLVEVIRENVKEKYDYVNFGFLELTEPSISDALNQQIQAGINKIVIFPYFLANGNHVTRDIPDLVQSYRDKCPKVSFIILPAFGDYAGLVNIISNMIFIE